MWFVSVCMSGDQGFLGELASLTLCTGMQKQIFNDKSMLNRKGSCWSQAQMPALQLQMLRRILGSLAMRDSCGALWSRCEKGVKSRFFNLTKGSVLQPHKATFLDTPSLAISGTFGGRLRTTHEHLDKQYKLRTKLLCFSEPFLGRARRTYLEVLESHYICNCWKSTPYFRHFQLFWFARENLRQFSGNSRIQSGTT